MIKKTWTVQIHNSLYIKQKQRQNKCIKQTTKLQKKKIKHSIFKINNDESISVNIQKVKTTLRIFKNENEQFSIMKKRFDISKNKVEKIIKKYHNESLQNHFDIFKTMQFLRRYCQFHNMRQKIETYIRKCFNCQKNKHNTHKKYKKIQYQISPNEPWNEMTMNFIIKLSLSMNSTTKKNYDVILIMINRLIKYNHIVSFKK